MKDTDKFLTFIPKNLNNTLVATSTNYEIVMNTNNLYTFEIQVESD